jgi:predicted transcriptional regulator
MLPSKKDTPAFTSMRRTTLYLEDEMALAIRRLAANQKRAQAEVIRDAIARYIRAEHRSTPRKLGGIGAYRSGRHDVAENAEAILRKAVRENR